MPWYRGNLHTHTTESDGRRDPQVVIDDYAGRGYDFLAISDHDMITDPASFDARGMVLIRANEVTARGGHILHAGAASRIEPDSNRQNVLDAIRDDGGFAVMAHPNWKKNHDHWSREALDAHEGFLGIEVFNGVIDRLPGKAVATDRWDELLTDGRKVWGFAHDDSHEAGDVARGWLMVQASVRSSQAILEAIHQGQFYASTGVTIERIGLQDDELVVETADAQRIAVIADSGRRVHEVDAAQMRFSIPADADWQYLRVECFGPAEARAWTQPFFLRKNGGQ
ncbi:MAG: CehA/McbA family metallohydrolase [Persicimonas sp.]